jgi:hypothetical protein
MSAASARVLRIHATGAVNAAYVRRVLSPARLLKIGFSIVGVAFAAQLFSRAWPPGFDTYCYWSVNPASPYTHAWTELGAFSYSPPMVLLFGLAQNLPFGVFLVLWMGFSIAVLMWLPSCTAHSAGPCRSLRGQRPPARRRGNRPGFPLPGHVVSAAADQGHARHRTPLVCRPTGVAVARDRPGHHCRNLRRHSRDRARPLAPMVRLPGADGGDAAELAVRDPGPSCAETGGGRCDRRVGSPY